MGNKGGYILTSLAKDKTQIISDLVLFMDFVSVANSAVVGEVPFLHLAGSLYLSM